MKPFEASSILGTVIGKDYVCVCVYVCVCLHVYIDTDEPHLANSACNGALKLQSAHFEARPTLFGVHCVSIESHGSHAFKRQAAIAVDPNAMRLKSKQHRFKTQQVGRAKKELTAA